MKITIYQNREVYKEESKIGNDSENKVETLEFEFPEEYRDFTKYIEFQIKGEKYVDLIEDNKYVITREVAKYGKIKTQLVLKKNIENDVLIFKSNVFELNVSKSINASENLVNTVGVDLIEKIVTKNNEQDTRLDALEADNTTNKENISNLQNDNTTNKSDIKSLQDDNEVNKTDISNIKQEQTVQNTNIQELQTDNTSNKSKIVNLEMKNAEQDNKIVSLETKNTQQDTSIQTNTESIAQLKEKDTAQDSLIEKLQAENTKLKKEINSMQIPGEATGNPIHLTDSSDLPCEISVVGNSEQETGDVTDEEGNVIGASPSPDYPSEIVTVGQNGSVEIVVNNGLETTDTNYQSYTKVLPIQQEMLEGDYIEDVEHHGWGKYEITGNEDWKKSRNPNNISYYLIINSILVNIDGNTFSPSSSGSETKVAIVLSNHFKAISPNQLFEGSENGICLNWVSGEKEMRLGFGLDSDINTVDKLKAWLKSLYDAGTPVIVYYKLATPKSLELTEDQKSVLNSLYTYKGITNISVDGIATLKVNYKKDLETIINKLLATSVAE